MERDQRRHLDDVRTFAFSVFAVPTPIRPKLYAGGNQIAFSFGRRANDPVFLSEIVKILTTLERVTSPFRKKQGHSLAAIGTESRVLGMFWPQISPSAGAFFGSTRYQKGNRFRGFT